MELEDIISQESILAELKVSNRKQLLLQLSEVGAEITGLDQDEIFKALNDREKLGSTGVGHGVAIPHARFPDLEGVYGAFARLSSPVDFDSVDDEPVDLVFLLLAGDGAGANHLKALARVSRLMREERSREALRGSGNAETIYSLIVGPEANAA